MAGFIVRYRVRICLCQKLGLGFSVRDCVWFRFCYVQLWVKVTVRVGVLLRVES